MVTEIIQWPVQSFNDCQRNYETMDNEILQWWEFETTEAVYLTWQQPSGTWAGIEFIGADRSKRRNDAFLARFSQEPQWVSPSLLEAQEAIRRVIVSRARLLESIRGEQQQKSAGAHIDQTASWTK